MGLLVRNMEQYGTMPLHAQALSCHRVPSPLPSPSLVSLRPGNLHQRLCRAGRAFRTPLLPHMCPPFPPVCSVLVGDGDFSYCSGIFTHLQRGVPEQLWPHTSNEWSCREKRCSHRVTLGLLSPAVLHTALMRPGTTKDPELLWSQLGGCRCCCVGAQGDRHLQSTFYRESCTPSAEISLPASIPSSCVTWVKEPQSSGPLFPCWHDSTLTNVPVSQTCRVDLLLCIRKAVWDWSANNFFIYLFIWWYDKNRMFL